MTTAELQGRELDAALARALDVPVRAFSDDLNAMHKVEDELDRRGLAGQYLTLLFDLIDPTDGWLENEKWAIAHATAEQKARAALAVLMEAK